MRARMGNDQPVLGYPAAVQPRDLIDDETTEVNDYEKAFAEWVDGMGQDKFPFPNGVSPYGIYVPTRFRRRWWGVSSFCKRHFVPRRPRDGAVAQELLTDSDSPADPVEYHLSRQTFSMRTPRDYHMASSHTASDYQQFPIVDIVSDRHPLIDGLEAKLIGWLNHHIIHGRGEDQPEGILGNAVPVPRTSVSSMVTNRDRTQSAIIIPKEEMNDWMNSPMMDTPSWDGSEIILDDEVGGTDGKALLGFFSDYLIVEDVGMALRCREDADLSTDVVHWVATVFIDGRIASKNSFMDIEDDR